MKRPFLRRKSKSEVSLTKDEIQRLLREIRKILDGGCVLRDSPESGACGGYRADGELILQYDHLHSRTHAVSFSDYRLGVIVCKRHHLFWKRQYPAEYERLIRGIIGKERCELLDKVREDYKPHKVDLKLEVVALSAELKKLQ